MAAIILLAGCGFSSMVSAGGLFHQCTDGTFDMELYDSNLCFSMFQTKCHKIETQEKCDKKKKCQWDIFAPTANCISIDDTLTEEVIVSPYPSGQYVKLTQTTAAPVINLAEVEVYDESNALISSSMEVTGSSEHSTTHALANITDGNKTNFGHTADESDVIDYMQIDLGAVKQIRKIVITNRTDCCKDRIDGLKVQVLDASNTLVDETPTITGEEDVYTLTFPEKVWSGQSEAPQQQE